MKAYETSSTVGGNGQVRVTDVPFAPGTQVEVTISPKRKSAEEFTTAWQRVCQGLRSSPAARKIDDDEIKKEIDDHRTGR